MATRFIYLFLFLPFARAKRKGRKKNPTVINNRLKYPSARHWAAGGWRGERGRRRSPLGCGSARALPVRIPEDLRLWAGRRPRGPASPFAVPPLLRAATGGARDFVSLWCYRCRLSAHEVPAGAGSGSALPSHDGRRGPARGAGLAPGAAPGQLSSSGRDRCLPRPGERSRSGGVPDGPAAGALRWRWHRPEKGVRLKIAASRGRLRLMGELRAGSLRAR